MKRTIGLPILPYLLAAGALYAAPAQAQPPSASDLTITVNVVGTRSAEGSVLAALYDSRKSSLSDWRDAVAVRRTQAGDTAPITFQNVDAGTYAVVIVHDEDNDGQMDTNFIGLPVEGFGASNNPVFLGPPRFQSARFQVRGDKEVDVQVKYF